MQKAELRKTEDLKKRTKCFALRIIKLYISLPKRMEMQVIGKQILRSGTSVGTNYREGCRARSIQEFIAELGNSLQELEETDELIAIFVSSISTAKKRVKKG